MSGNGHAEFFERHLDGGFDHEHGRLCKERVLTWMPWVGKHYEAHSVLIVGESHYGKTRDGVPANIVRDFCRR